jgi:hypothetical protein
MPQDPLNLPRVREWLILTISAWALSHQEQEPNRESIGEKSNQKVEPAHED